MNQNSYTLPQALKCLLLGYLLLLFTAFGIQSFAQYPPKDILQVNALLAMGNSYSDREMSDSAAFFYQKAYQLAKQKGNKALAFKSAQLYLPLLNNQGKYKDALILAGEVVAYGKSLGQMELSTAYSYLGNLQANMGNLEASAGNFLQALNLAEALNDKALQMKYCNNLSSIFGELYELKKGQYELEKFFEYSTKSYALALHLKDTAGMTNSLINMGASELFAKRYANASKHLKEVIRLSQMIKDVENLGNIQFAYVNLGEVEEKQNNYHKALAYYQQSLQLLQYHPNPRSELHTYWGLSRVYFEQAMLTQANYYLAKSVAIGKSINSGNDLIKLYLLGAQIAEQLNKPLEALQFRKSYEALHDSLLNAETQHNIHRLEIEYQTTQKEKEIAQQELVIANNMLELQKKNNFIFISVAALFALVLILLIFYLLYRNKQRAAAEALRSVERESELKILMAMMDGEEKERSRLARELHDGVGGTLSATKMHLSLLRNRKSFPVEAIATLEKSVFMIDSASQEIRSISHNLSPEILQHYDLPTAINTFCQSVASDALKIDFYELGESMPLKNNFKLIIYRTVQELVNNIMKHAEASHALVQLSQHDQMLSLTVEDNGKGFELKESNGIGLTNLQSRVKDMGGTFTLESELGRGTTIYLEFDVTPFLEKQTLVTTAL